MLQEIDTSIGMTMAVTIDVTTYKDWTAKV